MKQNPWLVVFEGIFLRQRLRTASAVPPHANLSSATKHLICPRARTQPGSKAGPRMIQARSGATAHHISPMPPPTPALLPLPKHQMRCCCTSEPKPDICLCSTFELLKEALSVAQTGFGWGAEREHGRGYTVKSQNISSKLISSCAIISCSFFSFSCKSTPGKDSRLPN